MKRLPQNDFDQKTLEAMMERYRAELLRYQRATPPGRPTLEESLRVNSAPPPGAGEQPHLPAFGDGESPDEAERAAGGAPEDGGIWEQPAVLAAGGEGAGLYYQGPEEAAAPAFAPLAGPMAAPEGTAAAPLASPAAAPPLPAEDVPPPAPLAPSVPPDCLCHTEFEKCIGGYGSFWPYDRLDRYTCASFLQTPGKATEVLVRFAADLPRGAAETSRCRRSFSVKFFCEDGEYDMLGGHLPVSVGSDGQTLAACCAAMRADPVSGLRSKEGFWRFVAGHHQALNAALWLYTDLGTIGSYRTADGFCPPCWWINSGGEKTLVRARWLSRQRPRTLSRFEAEELAGSDPDAVSRDLVESVKGGEKVQYELAAQIIEGRRLESGLDFDPFDPTAEWPEHRFALQKLGLLTIDRLPQHFERELACARFDASNIIAGIEYPRLAASQSLDAAAAHIRSMGELSRRTLISNITDELRELPAGLLEEVLILFTHADLEFGRAVTAALGGI